MRILMLAATFASLAAAAAAQTADAPQPELIPGAAAPPGPRELVPGAAPPPELIPGAPPPDARRLGRGPGEGRHAQHLFISPSGEPFRGGDGLAAWFDQADLDHDGAITAEEFQADALRVFQRLDADGNGVLDGFEIQAYEQQVPEIGQIMAEEGGGRGGRRRGGGRERAPQPVEARQPSAGAQGAARFSLLNEPEPVLAADENVTGRVTREQWLRATARRFAKLDTGKTGRLTLDQLRPNSRKR